MTEQSPGSTEPDPIVLGDPAETVQADKASLAATGAYLTYTHAAERLTEERKALAQAEAEKLMADTRTQCEQLLQRTRAEVTRIEQQILRLKVERETFENKLLALLEEHRRLVELRRQESGIADKMRRGPSTGPQGPDGRD